MPKPVLLAGLVLLPSLMLGGCLSTVQNDFNRRHADTLYARDIDYTGAAQRYLKSAVEGNAEAAYRLSAMCCEGSISCGKSEALDWLTRAASSGHVTAQYMAGLAYLYGLYGAHSVPATALSMLEKASASQHALASFHLGLACSGAFGQLSNPQKALQAFDRRFPGFGHDTHGVETKDGDEIQNDQNADARSGKRTRRLQIISMSVLNRRGIKNPPFFLNFCAFCLASCKNLVYPALYVRKKMGTLK